jgi:hypothetical protein
MQQIETNRESVKPDRERITEILGSELSDGAKVAAITMLITGARTAREIAAATNRSLRSVERHYAELRASGCGPADSRTTQIRGVDHADSRRETHADSRSDHADSRSADSTRAHARRDSRANFESLRDESVPSAADNDSPTTSAATRETLEGNQSAREAENTSGAAADDLKDCRPIITALVRALYPNSPFPPRAGVEKFIRAALATGHSIGEIREAANILIGKAIDDEEIQKPAVLFARILGDVRREGVRNKPPIPPGAIDLGGGQYVSRW